MFRCFCILWIFCAAAALFAVDMPLDLGKAVNRGFRSEPDDPALPKGWTDDGPNNDLRMFPSGEAEYGGVRFRVIDPERNRGKAVLVLSNRPQRGVAEAVVAVKRRIGPTLFVLHTASWIGDAPQQVGEIVVAYADGSEQCFEVNRDRDLADWWDPNDKENARCVWTGRNPSARIGVFSSGFAIQDKKVRSVTFRSLSEAGWLILAAAGSAQPVVKIAPPEQFVLKADENWSEIDYPQPTVPGSALDFSFLLDAPAGKYGRLTVRDGRFEFADRPGARVKFYGTNFCESTSLVDHATAERQAAELAAIGFNSARIHHYENRLLKDGAETSLDYDPVRFDRLDYLIAQLKQRGIYWTIDAFCSREPKPGEIPGLEKLGKLSFSDYKPLFMIHRGALDNLKQHIRILLTRKNRYTGMTYGEDPSLATLSLVNENEIFGTWNLNPAIAALFEEAFEADLEARKIDPAGLGKLERSRLMTQFLADKQRAMIAELTAFIRDELKCDVLITDNNYQYSLLHNFIGEQLSYVDAHTYFDHPWFPNVAWRLPEQLDNVSAVEQLAKSPRVIFGQRLAGKPFMVTEFNSCFPNRYRAESGPIMGGYSALQDYDGIYRFDYIYNRGDIPGPQHLGGFSSGSDPACYFADKIGVLLFLRGDVRPAEKLYTLVYAENFMKELEKPLQMTTSREPDTTGLIPENFTLLGLKSRVAALNVKEYPALKNNITEAFAFHRLPGAGFRNWNSVKDSEFGISEKHDRVYRSDTGELELDAVNGTFKVDTPRSAALTMAWTSDGSAGPMAVSGTPGQRTVALTSLDGKELRASRKLLFFHLTTVYNTGIVFADKTMRRLESIGDLPMLVYRDRIGVELALEHPQQLEVVALNYDGTERETLKSRIENGKLSFRADSAAGRGSFVYLIREKKAPKR